MKQIKAIELLKADRDYCLTINNDKSIIKQYDEAIKELKELKNRKCINCKSFDKKNDKCERGVSTHYRSEIDDYYSFSCSRWESRI